MNAHPAYALVAVGVNRTPGSKVTLRHAELDAVRLGLAVTSAKGAIPPANAIYLLSKTTIADLDGQLDALARKRPVFLMFYFGGHGNAHGIGLADDLYSFVRLRKKLSAIGARGCLVVLNSCESGGMAKSATVLGGFEAVDPCWSAALLGAAPGMRVFMASRHDESTYEGAGGSWFVDALLRAMFAVRPGDLIGTDGTEFFSDGGIFDQASRHMRRLGVTPVAEGVFGDFPVMISNGEPAGNVSLAVRATVNLGITLDAIALHRRHLPTALVVRATDGYGNVLPPERRRFLPTSDRYSWSGRFHVDVGISPGCQQQLWQHGACWVAWDVAAVDNEDRLLGRRREVVTYRTDRPLVWR